jgi:imidazoleglycerol-phosphate dehydratase
VHELEGLCLRHDLGVDARQCKCAAGTIGGAAKALIKGGAQERNTMRKASVKRTTKETAVEVVIDLDGDGRSSIATGIGFLDHMLDLLARHSRIDIEVKAKGDLHIDHHHTTEDVGIALGQAVKQALGDMKGITRYADVHMPMDEALTRVALDISGRPFLVFKAEFVRDKVGPFDTELVQEWFQAFAVNAAVTLHVATLYGTNDHHIAESCFKGLARALRAAVAIDPRAAHEVPSTKGTLGG